MHKYFISASLFVLVSCASTEKYEAKLNTWIGKTEDSLVTSWGIPENSYQVNENKKLISYSRAQSVFIPGTAPTYQTNFIGNTAYTNSYGGSNSQTLHFSCNTTFTIENSIISSYTYKGNDCVSY